MLCAIGSTQDSDRHGAARFVYADSGTVDSRISPRTLKLGRAGDLGLTCALRPGTTQTIRREPGPVAVSGVPHGRTRVVCGRWPRLSGLGSPSGACGYG